MNRASIERMVVVSGRGTAEGDGNGLATEVDIIVVVGCFEMKMKMKPEMKRPIWCKGTCISNRRLVNGRGNFEIRHGWPGLFT